MESSAKLKYIRHSTRKMQSMAQQIRGMQVNQALALLSNIPRKGAKILKKAVEAAKANATYKDKKLDEDTLKITELYVNQGPTMKRIKTRARGRADRILKKSVHVDIKISDGKGME